MTAIGTILTWVALIVGFILCLYGALWLVCRILDEIVKKVKAPYLIVEYFIYRRQFKDFIKGSNRRHIGFQKQYDFGVAIDEDGVKTTARQKKGTNKIELLNRYEYYDWSTPSKEYKLKFKAIEDTIISSGFERRVKI